MVGSVMAADLSREAGFSVLLADRSSAALERARARTPGLQTLEADLSDTATITRLASEADVVCGALASHLGHAAIGAVIEAGKPYDIDVQLRALPGGSGGEDPEFYETWWFWTILAVAGGGAATAIALTSGGDESPPSANFTLQVP